MDWERARHLMVEQQIRTWDVSDKNVLDRLLTVKRENFVPEDKRALSFVEMELPLGIAGATMLQPKMEARIVQEVAPQKDDKVLVVGAGSGYLAALLGSFTREVYAVDIQPELVATAQKNLQKSAITNVSVELADGSEGIAKYAPYDIIVITGSMPILPASIKDQLAVGGRLFVVLGEAPDMKATLMTHKTAGEWEEKHLFETVLPSLMNAPEPIQFIF